MSTDTPAQQNGPDVDRAMAIVFNAMRNIKTSATRPGAPKRSSSFAAQVADLRQAESCAKIRAADHASTLDELRRDLPVLRERLRNACAPVVAAAKAADPSKEFTVEVDEMWSARGNLYVIAVVTRCD